MSRIHSFRKELTLKYILKFFLKESWYVSSWRSNLGALVSLPGCPEQMEPVEKLLWAGARTRP